MAEQRCRCGLAAHDGEPMLGAPENFDVTLGCWRIYGEVLSGYATYATFKHNLQLIVDAYALQHLVRITDPAAALHLMTLDLFINGGHPVADGARRHQAMAHHVRGWEKLQLPPNTVTMTTVADVARASTTSAHQAAVWVWARQVWACWETAHPLIQKWNRQLGFKVG